MDFFTISQYFNKLFSVLFIILLLPIAAFIGVYFYLTVNSSVANHTVQVHFSLLSIVVVLWALIFLWFNKKIESVRSDQGLRKKLEKYFRLTIVRYILAGSACLVLAYGFYLTGDDMYTWVFAGSLLILGILWPTSQKVSRDLKLRGDEREMVYYKKDQL